MLFNSINYLFFLPAIVLLYFLLPFHFRWIGLLIGSCFFYMCFIPSYILILFTLITIDYFSALMIQKSDIRLKKIYLILSLVSTCAMLIVFKYYDFFIENINQLLNLTATTSELKTLHLILPFGLSFHTFQGMSYIIEVYHGRQKAERHFGIYALYIMFFPQLVAGPIEKPQNLIHQFYKKNYFSIQKIFQALPLIIWGLFKKIAIADRLAVYVNPIFKDLKNYSNLEVALSVVFFAMQVYCDFSGYSDIARGSAQLLGFNLSENFKKPYLSNSLTEFWQRFHISLTVWFRDYIYIPLGGNKTSRWKKLFNILFVFSLTGLWHGANWTYITCGLLNGLFVSLEQVVFNFKLSIAFYKKYQYQFLFKICSRIYVLFLYCLAVTFFRASSFSEGLSIYKNFFNLSLWQQSLHVDLHLILICFALIAFVYVYEISQFILKEKNISSYLQLVFNYTLILVMIFFNPHVDQTFIYFQF